MKNEKKVSSSVSNWLTASIFVVILFWVLIGIIISRPISSLFVWMGLDGFHQGQVYGMAFLFCLAGVMFTLALEAYFLNGLEHDAKSYENSVRRYFDDRDNLAQRLNVTNEKLKMSDIGLLHSTHSVVADFSVGEVRYRTQLGNIPTREVRLTLEEDRRSTQARLNSLEWPKEPINVARWRKHIMRQKGSMANACA